MDKILVQIDLIDNYSDICRVAGWAVGAGGNTFRVLDPSGKALETNVKHIVRKDVCKAIEGADPNGVYGFEVSFKNEGLNYRMIISDGKHEKKVSLAHIERSEVMLGVHRSLRHFLNRPVETIRYMHEEGFGNFIRDEKKWMKHENYRYNEYFLRTQLAQAELNVQQKRVFPYMPKISLIVPAFRTPELYLRQMLDMVEKQTYSNWELCIADGSYPETGVIKVLDEYKKNDSRIRYTVLTENYGISGNTNKALEMVSGDWVALMDHDDLLTPDALYEIVKRINEKPDTEAVYTDEDKVTMNLEYYFQPTYKPDFDSDMLRSCNYVCHLFCAKKRVIDEAGPFNPECDGSQDLDFIMRVTEKAKRTEHIAKILYHWRSHPASTAENPENKMYCYAAGARAVNMSLQRKKIPAQAYMSSFLGYYNTFFNVPEKEPLISVVMYGQGDCEKSEKAVRAASPYTNYEFLQGIKAAEKARGEYLLFMKAGDTPESFSLESSTGRIVTEAENGQHSFPYNLLGTLKNDPHIAAVGGKVLAEDNTNVFAGAAMNRTHGADMLFYGAEKEITGYIGMDIVRRRVPALSLHCLMLAKETFRKAGGFDPAFEHFRETDLCYRLLEQGYELIYDPTVTVRTQENTKIHPHLRYRKEAAALAKKHEVLLEKGDPYTNPSLKLHRGEWLIG